MKLLQRARKCSPHTRREDQPQRRFEPTFAGKLLPASRPQRLAALALLAFAICLSAPAVAAATESLNELCLRLQHSRDVAERIHAAEAIAEHRQRAVPRLCELLRHSDAKVREFAVVAIVRIGPEAERAVPQLAAILEASQDPTRATAVLALGRIGPAATPAVPAILRVAHDPDWRLREYAIDALASIGTVEAVRALTALLQSDERDLQIAALKAIQQCGPSAASALPDLLELGVTASDPDLRDEAFLTAGQLGEEAVQDLVALFDADQGETRRRAAMALSRMGAPRETAVQALEQALHDTDAAVRFWAAKALGGSGLKDPSTQLALAQALTDPDADVRWAAADALHRSGLDATSATSILSP